MWVLLTWTLTLQQLAKLRGGDRRSGGGPSSAGQRRGLAQDDLKRLLAYDTISQIGIMAVGRAWAAGCRSSITAAFLLGAASIAGIPPLNGYVSVS